MSENYTDTMTLLVRKAQRYPSHMEILELDNAPDDPALVADEVLIGPGVWAKYQGVAVETVWRSNSLAKDERASATAEGRPVKAGMMPAPSQTIRNGPYWTMQQFREWKASRPGRGAGGGRRPGAVVKRTATHAQLPLVCPCGCDYVITAAEVAGLPTRDTTKSAGRLTPKDVAAMPPAQRIEALKAGKLDHLVGTARERRSQMAHSAEIGAAGQDQ